MLWPAHIKQMLRLLCPCRLSHRSLCPPPERLIPTSLTNLGGNLGVALAGRDRGQHRWPLEIREDYEVQRSCPSWLVHSQNPPCTTNLVEARAASPVLLPSLRHVQTSGLIRV